MGNLCSGKCGEHDTVMPNSTRRDTIDGESEIGTQLHLMPYRTIERLAKINEDVQGSIGKYRRKSKRVLGLLTGSGRSSDHHSKNNNL